jgi:predicted LPLAT superfamily acyltransferase
MTSEALRSAAAPAPPRWYTHRRNRPAVYRAGAMLAGALPRPARLTVTEAAALAQGVAVLKATIRRAPEQGFNFLDVWSATPAS